MEWSCLGHAMWLVEAAGLRLLCDPLLGPEHHCGVFETVPRRSIDAARLRADFVLVSHRHPDHFDVPSLDRLARLDPETVVLTPDALVAWAARRLGFRTVHEVPPGQHVALDGVRLVTTPSLGADEWGVMVASEGAVAWNQVDAVLRDPAHVAQVLAATLPFVDATRVELAIVRWQPMLEIAAVLGRRTAFPYDAYADLLAQAAAIGAVAVVPGANGAAHVEAFAWMDRFVFPVSEPRFCRDVEQASPGTRALPLHVGGRYHVTPGAVSFDPEGARDLVRLEPSRPDPRHYRPLTIPALVDVNPGEHDEASMRAEVRAWIHGDLCRGLLRAWPRLGVDRPLRLLVDVAFPTARDVYSIDLHSHGAAVHERDDDDWDLLNEIAGSLLWEVVQGRRHWGDVLLAGSLRACTRAYEVSPTGLRRAAIGETFLYYGLGYDEAVQRAVRWQVEALVAERPIETK